MCLIVLILALRLRPSGSFYRTGGEDERPRQRSTVELWVGDTMEVIQDGNPTTGFAWER